MVTSSAVCCYAENKTQEMIRMYMPIWILYWFPFFLPVNYIVKFCIVYSILFLFSKTLKTDGICTISKNIKCWCFSILAEIMGIGVFYLCETNIKVSTYYGYYTVFCLIALFITVIISFLLNYFFSLNKIDLSKKQRVLISTLLTFFSAPYLFLLPSGVVY